MTTNILSQGPFAAAPVYARHLGWRVLPVEPRGKRPLLKDWPNRASADLEQIAQWKVEYPGSNVGVATGHGFFVLDVDPRHGGDTSLAALIAKHGQLPMTAQQSTPSGGSHYVFAADVPVATNASKLGPGLDLRGMHGQFVVAPSFTDSGAYRWVHAPWDVPPAPAPAWLMEGLGRNAPATAAPSPDLRGYFPPATSAELDAARESLEAHGPAIEGSGGDAHTVHAAAIVTHDHALTDEEAWPLFVEWNETCVPPWPLDELRVKLTNGLKYGKLAYGCKRTLDVVAAAKRLIEAWRNGTEGDTGIPSLVAGVRVLVARGIDPTERGLIERELKGATGLKSKELNLPPAIDRVKLAERETRRKSLGTSPELIDLDDPFGTARKFLRAHANDEGLPELVRWQEEFWRALRTHYELHPSEALNAATYPWLESKRDVETNEIVKPDSRSVEVLGHALKAAAYADHKTAPAWLGPSAGKPDPSEFIACANGLLHLLTRELHPPTRALFNLNALEFGYDPNAPAPEAWLGFLDQLWPDDAESIATFQEMCGLFLTGDTSHQKLFMLIGPKRSGKGTIGRVLTGLVGSANVAAPTLNGIGQHFGLQGLIAKPLAIVSDVRLGRQADVASIAENLLRISGEDTVGIPRKHTTDFTAKLSTRFLLFSNEPPALIDQSGALASRFIVLRLTRSFFGHEDRALTQRLLRELPGILLWSLAGLDRLRARGHFVQPGSARDLVEQLEQLGSPVQCFVEENCRLDPCATVACSRLFQEFRYWSEQQGRDHPGSAQMLGKHLSAAYPQVRVVKRRVGGRLERHYEGISLEAHEAR